jgi:hypothetical protein
VLDGDLNAEVVWEAGDDPPNRSLTDLIADQWDINKMAHYLPVYESVLAPRRHRSATLLEIGVNFGGSLALWRDYLARATIVGIDNNPRCALFDDPVARINVRIGQQQDVGFLDTVIEEFGPFDIIIDDGSHIAEHTLASFNHLFAHGLADGGAYLVEDLHTCYATDMPAPRAPVFTDVLKHLIDVMHALYTQTPTGDQFANSFEPDNPGYRHAFRVPAATMLISKLEISDSIAVIHKGPRPLPRMIRRWSREQMTRILNPDAARFLDEHPHLGEADETRRDWVNRRR